MKKIMTNIFTILICIVGTGQAATFDRGNGLIYDDVLDITWLQNANLSGQTFNWQGAVDWADTLNFGGFDDWRLASMDVNNDDTVIVCNGTNELACRDNELGYMFYENLGGIFGDDLSGTQSSFNNIENVYWSETDFVANLGDAWVFGFDGGNQGPGIKVVNNFFAWAVRPGDVNATVPEPATFTILGLGLLGFWVSARRKC